MSECTAAFLFSIDLEDVRTMIPEGPRFSDGVARTMVRYLAFLERNRVRCTFFVLGDIARRYPDLVREIAECGHEIACHGNDHRPLDQHDARSFRQDLQRNLDNLRAAGAGEICGFRAPIFSLTRETRWAHEVLADLGFCYSSSVLSAASPLYGWPGFSYSAVRTEAGIWELPLSMSRLPLLNVPFAGGVYLRTLPFPLIRCLFEREARAGRPVVSYCHPYDIDTKQERLVHPGLGGSRFLNLLMYRNRKTVIPRLERLVGRGYPILPYADYVARALERNGARSG